MSVWAAFEDEALARLRGHRGVIALAVGGHALVCGAAAATGRGGAAGSHLTTSLAAASALTGLALLHGVVSGDVRSGRALLWLQKPVAPVPFHLARWAEATGVALLVTAALSALTVPFLGLVSPDEVEALLRSVPSLLLLELLLAVLVLACSAWGAYPDAVPAVVLFVVLGAAPALWTAGGPVGGALGVVAPPFDAVQEVDAWLGGGDGRILPALGSLAAYGAFWLGVGAAGLARTTRSALPRDVAR